MIKLVFSDMDGTLLDADGQMPPEFDAVMAELRARGVVFAPASGRQYYALLRQMGKYQDEFIFVAENGTFVAQHDQELFSSVIAPAAVRAILARADALPEVFPVLCGKRLAYVRPQWQPYVTDMTQYFTRYEMVEDLAAVAAGEDIIKVALCDCRHGEAETRIYPAMQEFSGPLKVALSSHYWVDVMNDGINKGVAVQKLQQRLGIAPEECAAFGDYLNDAEMLAAVGYGFAMANAHPDVKKIARYEAPANTEHGVMVKLRELMQQGLVGRA